MEVASERLGLPTDPFVLVQRVTTDGAQEKLTDVAELNDIPPPMKPSTNGYSATARPTMPDRPTRSARSRSKKTASTACDCAISSAARALVRIAPTG